MATKRRKRTTRALGAPARRRTRRRSTTGRRRRRSSSLRSNGTSLMTTVKGGAMAMAHGAIGSIAYGILSKMIPTAGKTADEIKNMQLIAAGGLGILATMMKKPMIAAGIGGVIGVTLGQKLGLLADDFDNTDFVPDSLMTPDGEQMYINDNGTILLPLGDGSWREATPMEARSLVNKEFALGAGNFDTIYPGYNNPGMYDYDQRR